LSPGAVGVIAPVFVLFRALDVRQDDLAGIATGIAPFPIAIGHRWRRVRGCPEPRSNRHEGMGVQYPSSCMITFECAQGESRPIPTLVARQPEHEGP